VNTKKLSIVLMKKLATRNIKTDRKSYEIKKPVHRAFCLV
jgi:hypothetical protein